MQDLFNLSDSDIDFSLSFHHFDPNNIQTDETVNCVFVVDVSPSVQSYIGDLNHAFNDFVSHIQQSHLADQLLVSVVEFDEKVRIRSGFQPILHLPRLQFLPSGGGTALYDATMHGLRQAIDYRDTLLISGISVKTLLFVITDGEDNSSTTAAAHIKTVLQKIEADERNAFSFTTVLFGVGSAAAFGKAQRDMGIRHLATVGTSGAEIRRMIGIISQSVASVAGGQAPIVF
ncbi:MAG: VWA domain-containing protein [Chitinophagales bacterium]|nr:VWA domain-containing protein [Chitinophagales bacterium]